MNVYTQQGALFRRRSWFWLVFHNLEKHLFLLEPGTKVNGQYYRDELLAKMIPEMDAISGGDYIFQQDGARAHTAKDTIKYIKDNMPDYIPPEMWPP